MNATELYEYEFARLAEAFGAPVAREVLRRGVPATRLAELHTSVMKLGRAAAKRARRRARNLRWWSNDNQWRARAHSVGS